MSQIQQVDVSEADSLSEGSVSKLLRKMENEDASEILGWQLILAEGSTNQGINTVSWQVNDNLPRSSIEAFDFPDEDTSDVLAQAKLDARFAIAYSDALINRVRRRLLITRAVPARPGRITLDRIIEIANEEHAWFGGRKEDEDEPSMRVRRYWQEGLGEDNLTGKSDVPWSAAFISFVMRKAGLNKSQFAFSGAHRTYINAAVKAREENNLMHAFWGCQLHEQEPKVGDMICAWYENEETAKHGAVSFKTTKTKRAYPSHCDIVVAKEAGRISTIGGNVSNSVTLKHYQLINGKLTQETFEKGFAILVNRLAEADLEVPPAQLPVPSQPGAKFTINTNLKTTRSPLNAEKIRAFFEKQPGGRDSLKDIGGAVMAATEKYGINATYIVAHAILESGWGLSNIAQTKNNLFGWRAYDHDTSQARVFTTRAECIDYVMGRVNVLYLLPDGRYFNSSPCVGDMHHGMNVNYASDPKWGSKIADLAGLIEMTV